MILAAQIGLPLSVIGALILFAWTTNRLGALRDQADDSEAWGDNPTLLLCPIHGICRGDIFCSACDGLEYVDPVPSLSSASHDSCARSINTPGAFGDSGDPLGEPISHHRKSGPSK